MGRPPSSGGPVFRFTPGEVAEMEACLQEINHAIPSRESISALADKFSASAERAGKVVVNSKQVWNWFQNRRYAQRSKTVKTSGKLSVTPTPRDDSIASRNLGHPVTLASARNSLDGHQMEFEARSARDGAWYDVANFLSHRGFETGDPEVRVRFSGFGIEEDEWVNVRRCVRPRSLPCEPSECAVVLPGDLILCFQEGKDQALYFDAHILDAQRRRHDARGCRCRFLVRYDHDQCEEIVPLRKICRRPETDFRLQVLHANNAMIRMDPRASTFVPAVSQDLNMAAAAATVHKPQTPPNPADVNMADAGASQTKEHVTTETVSPVSAEGMNNAAGAGATAADAPTGGASC